MPKNSDPTFEQVLRRLSAISIELDGLRKVSIQTSCHAKATREKVLGLLGKGREIRDALVDMAEEEQLQTAYDSFNKFQQTVSDYEGELLDICQKNPTSDPQGLLGKPEVKLPRVELPIFNGQIDKWPTFAANFNSILNRFPHLSEEEKLTYLKSSLKGSASQMVEFIIPGTKRAFQEAWTQLEKRFSNKRDIVSNIFNQLLNFKCTDDSQLDVLIDKARVTIQTLDMMGMQASTVDFVWNAIVLNKLDRDTRSAWEHTHVDDSIPPIEKLLGFLQQRANSAKIKPEVQTPARPSDPNPKSQYKSQSGGQQCPECKLPHFIYKCPVFLKANVEERMTIVKKFKLCNNCLSPGHMASSCKSPRTCRHCDKTGHNSLLHRTVQKMQTNLAVFDATILRPTAVVKVEGANNCLQEARALIDAGSTVSCITEKLANKLQLSATTVNETIKCLAGATALATKLVKIKINSRKNDFCINVTAAVVPSITGLTPSDKVSKSKQLNKVHLADPNFHIPGDIDILIGAGELPKIHLPQFISFDDILAQQTKLGYIITGSASNMPVKQVQVNCSNVDLEKFWQLEEVPKKKILTIEEQACEDIFVKTTKVLEDGRYSVDLPFKTPNPNMGSNRQAAVARMLQLEKRFQRDPEFGKKYKETISEYQQTGHMIPATGALGPSYYLPHHGVLAPSKKLRVVFDGSAQTSSNISLNTQLLKGPTVQAPLFDILINFRTYKMAVCGDIQQMYRQIWVNPHHHNYQKVVWRENEKQPLQDFALTTVTWGTKSAPYLATRTLAEVAQKAEGTYPLAARKLKEDAYVDDIITGGDTEEEAEKILQDLTHVLGKAGFTLHKIASNVKKISNSSSEREFTDSESKALGILWNHEADVFKFADPQIPPHTKVTKRTVLSDAGKIFDPLGWVSPVTVKLKVFVQSLWQVECDWDSPLDKELCERWAHTVRSLKYINRVSVPRLSPRVAGSVLCGFADASEKAYAAVVYLRTPHDGSTSITLLASRTKVAPLKKISIPRLELCAAVLLSSLLTAIQTAMKTTLPCYLWTDSTVTLAWITSHPSKWKTFVANRVTEVQAVVPPDKCRHVVSVENPADVATRGATPEELILDKLWWNGPSWLKDKDFDKPTPIHVTNVECKSVSALVVQLQQPLPVFKKFSSFIKTVNVIAYVRKFIDLLKKKVDSPTLTANDIQASKDIIFKMAQCQEFNDEIMSLKKEGQTKMNSKVKGLDVFIDPSGILRVGGRLKNSDLPVEQAHPILLPRSHHITRIYAQHVHNSLGHVGPQHLISTLRQQVWIPAVRNLARTTVNRCVTCTRLRAKTATQMMADLPDYRVKPARPFTTTGVDMAGPFSLKTQLARGSRSYKAYMAIFVCFATRAVHIELVTSLSADGFLAAFQRFTARRGVPNTMKSDRGTNFVAAAKILQDFHDDNKVKNSLVHQGVTWKFNPPAAPHWGGLWEAGVKSAKFHLFRIIGAQLLTYEEMSTVLCRVEAIMNSRPITELQVSPNDEEALTPAHFLVGTSLTSPDNSIEPPSSLNQRWRLVNAIHLHFWQRWSAEYLTRLQQRPKWTRPRRNFEIDDLVIIKDPNAPPLQWRLGRVIEVHTSVDNMVRSVTLKTQHSTMQRPVTQVCHLPLPSVEPSKVNSEMCDSE